MKELNKTLKNEDIELEDDLDFNLWKEELNKDLTSFWKMLKRSYHK